MAGGSVLAARGRGLSVALAAGALAACTWAPSPPEQVAEPLDPPASTGAFAPYLSPGPLLSWLEPEGEQIHRLVYSRLSDGDWQPPREVVRSPAMFANWADVPAVVAAPAGAGSAGSELRAHWLEKLGSGTYAYGIRWQARTESEPGWRSRGWLHEDDLSEAEHGFVSWALGGSDDWVFWLDGRDHEARGAMTLRAGRVRQGSIEGELLDERVCDCCPTDAATTGSGPIVVYRDRSEDEIRDIAAVRWTGEGWSPPRAVFDDGWKIAGCPVNGPAVDARGETVAVAWFTAPEDKAMVRMAFSEDGGETFTPPILVDGDVPLGRVDVALLERGDAVVSWLARGPAGASTAALSVRRVSPRGRAGAPLVLARPPATRASGIPRILVDDGALLFTWVDPEASRLRAGRLPLGKLPRIPR